MHDTLGAPARIRSDGHRTTSEYVRESVRRAILNGELKGGSLLAPGEIAEALEVSTTPVRAALRDLAAEGLIRFDAYRGGITYALTYDDMEDIIGLRQVLEPVAVRKAITGLTDELLARAAAHLTRMTDDPFSSAWVEHNRAFHFTLYEGAASPRLIATISSLQDPTVMYVSSLLQGHPDIRAKANHHHAVLLEAMRSRDLDRAVQITLEHLALPLQIRPVT